MRCATGTMETAAALSAVTPRLTRTSTRKVATALALVEHHVDTEALLDAADVWPATSSPR